jgi:hypothetical protein
VVGLVVVEEGPSGVVESLPHAATRLVTTVRALTPRSAAKRCTRPLSSGPKSLSNRLEELAENNGDLSGRITPAQCAGHICSASECTRAGAPPSNYNKPRKANALSERRKPSVPRPVPLAGLYSRFERRVEIAGGGTEWWEGAARSRARAGPNHKRRSGSTSPHISSGDA